MAAPKTLKTMAGATVPSKEVTTGHPVTPPNLDDLSAMVLQLQNTVAAVIAALKPPSPGWIITGGVVTKDTGALTVDVTAGELETEAGVFRAFALSSNLAIAANASGNPRIDLVQVHVGTGVISRKGGTAAVAPVAPTPDASNIALATVGVPDSATEPDTPTDVRPRPARAFTGAAVATSTLFTTD